MQIIHALAMSAFIKDLRLSLGIKQKHLALTSGTGLRFIIDLEKGKPTCQIGKILTVLRTLGVKIELTPPATATKKHED